MRRFAALAVLAALPARAETPVGPEAFDAYTRGKTLTYAEDGRVYGFEEYRAGREVTWAFANGDCVDGHWYPAGDMICFVYENNPEPQCWLFFEGQGGLIARFMNLPSDDLVETRASPEPLRCEGVYLGV